MFSQKDSSELLSFGTPNSSDGYSGALKKLEFNDSIDTSKVENMSNMFTNSSIKNLDLSGFNTPNLTIMEGMFSWSKAEVIDMSNFDTSNVTNMSWMFSGASKLKTIYAGEKFSINDSANISGMFSICDSLVGGAGTVFDSDKTDKTYARIDEGTSTPGYFTRK